MVEREQVLAAMARPRTITLAANRRVRMRPPSAATKRDLSVDTFRACRRDCARMNRAAARTRPGWLTPQHALWALLVFVVLAPLAEILHWGDVTVFAFAALAIIPLAGIMGESTEKLAARFGAGVGGLLNATFGNAAEMIIAL